MLEPHPQCKLSGVVQGPTMHIKHTPIYLGNSKDLKIASQDWRQRAARFFSTWKQSPARWWNGAACSDVTFMTFFLGQQHYFWARQSSCCHRKGKNFLLEFLQISTKSEKVTLERVSKLGESQRPQSSGGCCCHSPAAICSELARRQTKQAP